MNTDPLHLDNLDSVTDVNRVNPDTLIIEGVQGGVPVTRPIHTIDPGNEYYNITREALDTIERQQRARMKK